MKTEWGFDLTDFGSVAKFKGLLKRHKLLSGYKKEKTSYGTNNFIWSNSKLKLITSNNPITGEYSNKGQRENEKGYASYMGIIGQEKEVMLLVKDIKNVSIYIKGESPYKRDFI